MTKTGSYHGVLPTTQEKQWSQHISDLEKMIGWVASNLWYC